jgi:hypothetical protein
VNGATPAKLFQDFDRAVAGPGSGELGQFLGRAEVFGVVNLRGSRFFQRSEGRDVISCVNREGVHSDTIHRSVRTKGQVNCGLAGKLCILTDKLVLR